MKKQLLKTISIAAFFLFGFAAFAQTNATANQNPQQQIGHDWQLLQTKDGVSCYYKTDYMGSGTGVYLRFVNNSGANVTINWTVNVSKDNAKNGKLTMETGTTVDSMHQPAGSDFLAVRLSDSSKPIISFTASK